MKKIEIRPDGSRRVYTVFTEKSRTDGSFKKDCDVNNIMKKYLKTGEVTHIARTQGVYADVAAIPDLATALNQVNLANDAFLTLPAKTRERFGNDPRNLVNFLQDRSNLEEAISLGLVEKPAPQGGASEEPVPQKTQSKTKSSKNTPSGSEMEPSE